ncbi:MAG: hypothetical protein KDA75_05595 [Planctomycetaceae bacterium]|nr:hypothetical protein [Planctomycetaceae bacterium]
MPPHSESDPPVAESDRDRVSVVPVGSGDLGGLSRRIARRTTDLIAIALILIGGLTVAQRLVVWWKTDPSETLANPEALFSSDSLAPWGGGPEGVSLDLGEQPLTLHRRVVRGSRDDAIHALQEDCRTAVAGFPADRFDSLPPREERESRLLQQLGNQSPIDMAADRTWSVYAVPGPVAMVFGTRRESVDAPPVRIVCWGLIMPSPEETWTLLRIVPRLSSNAAGNTESIPLPSNCRPGLSVRGDVEGELVTFSGHGPAAEWRKHFDHLAVEQEWRPLATWRTEAANWSAAWLRQRGTRLERIDLQLTQSETGWAGLINISPAGTGLPGPNRVQ